MTDPISPHDSSPPPRLTLTVSGAGVDVCLGVGFGVGVCLGVGAVVEGSCVGACVVGAAVVGCGLGRLVRRGLLLVAAEGDGAGVVGWSDWAAGDGITAAEVGCGGDADACPGPLSASALETDAIRITAAADTSTTDRREWNRRRREAARRKRHAPPRGR